MSAIRSLLPLLLSSAFYGFADSITRPMSANWSSESYGFDGPWNSVALFVGYNGTLNNQKIDVLPDHGSYTAVVLPGVCEQRARGVLPCSEQDRRVGFYDASLSNTALKTPRSITPTFNGFDGYVRYEGVGYYDRIYITFANGPDAYSLNALVAFNISYKEFPNGKKVPITTGSVDLGWISSQFTEPPPASSPNKLKKAYEEVSPLPSALQMKHFTPSASTGLQIGSPEWKIPGSLYFGGYDRTRVLEPVIAQPITYVDANELAFYLNLVDFGVHVSHGMHSTTKRAPIPVGSKIGVVTLNTYSYFSPSILDALTADLPVTYDEGLGTYLWDESSPLYHTLRKSKSYVFFTLQSSVGGDPQTLKIPIQLLMLTFQPPLVDRPTKYFPFSKFAGDPGGGSLGRGILQALFLGLNWRPDTRKGYFFLAQAPGPDAFSAPVVTAIQDTDTTIRASSDLIWEDTWRSVWTLENEPAELSQNGLSRGATVGLGLGLGVGGAILATAALILFRRRQTSKQVLEANRVLSSELEAKHVNRIIVSEADPGSAVSELHADVSPRSILAELYGDLHSRRMLAELPINEEPAELVGDAKC